MNEWCARVSLLRWCALTRCCSHTMLASFKLGSTHTAGTPFPFFGPVVILVCVLSMVACSPRYKKAPSLSAAGYAKISVVPHHGEPSMVCRHPPRQCPNPSKTLPQRSRVDVALPVLTCHLAPSCVVRACAGSNNERQWDNRRRRCSRPLVLLPKSHILYQRVDFRSRRVASSVISRRSPPA